MVFDKKSEKLKNNFLDLHKYVEIEWRVKPKLCCRCAQQLYTSTQNVSTAYLPLFVRYLAKKTRGNFTYHQIQTRGKNICSKHLN